MNNLLIIRFSILVLSVAFCILILPGKVFAAELLDMDATFDELTGILTWNAFSGAYKYGLYYNSDDGRSYGMLNDSYSDRGYFPGENKYD